MTNTYNVIVPNYWIHLITFSKQNDPNVGDNQPLSNGSTIKHENDSSNTQSSDSSNTYRKQSTNSSQSTSYIINALLNHKKDKEDDDDDDDDENKKSLNK
ncbi:hypothetical protein ACTFIU_010907 [Dictyostelium citrinum]